MAKLRKRPGRWGAGSLEREERQRGGPNGGVVVVLAGCPKKIRKGIEGSTGEMYGFGCALLYVVIDLDGLNSSNGQLMMLMLMMEN